MHDEKFRIPQFVQQRNVVTLQQQFYLYIIRLVPQGTVNNNLGPDRLAGPNALDTNQPSDCTTFVWKS